MFCMKHWLWLFYLSFIIPDHQQTRTSQRVDRGGEGRQTGERTCPLSHFMHTATHCCKSFWQGFFPLPSPWQAQWQWSFSVWSSHGNWSLQVLPVEGGTLKRHFQEKHSSMNIRGKNDRLLGLGTKKGPCWHFQEKHSCMNIRGKRYY